MSFVTSKRNNSTTRYVQNTLDPVFYVESDGELGSDSKPRGNGFIRNRYNYFPEFVRTVTDIDNIHTLKNMGSLLRVGPGA